jgi:hypothetical protein
MDPRDVLTAIWMTTVCGILFVAIPSLVRLQEPRASRFAGRFARVVLLTVVGVRILSGLHLLNWFTLLLLYAAGPVAGWLRRHEWHLDTALRDTARPVILRLARFYEVDSVTHFARTRLATRSPIQYLRRATGAWVAQIHTPGPALLAAGIAAAISATILLRFGAPLHERRLGHPEAYSALLAAQRLLHNDTPAGWPRAFPAVAAATSLLSSLDLPDVVRFLGPLLGCVLVLAAARAVRAYTGTTAAAVLALWALGGFGLAVVSGAFARDARWTGEFGQILAEALSRQSAAGDAELGALGLLLAAVCWRERQPAHVRQVLVDTASCLAVVAVAAPALLLVAALGGLGSLLPSPLALAVLAGAWLLPAAPGLHASQGWLRDVLATLPIGMVLLGGGITYVAAHALRWITADATDGVLIALCAGAWLMLPAPPASRRHYLEYEAAARQTLDVSKRFPREQWLIVAPVEQLAFAYGLGWYRDLGQFVGEYRDQAEEPGFSFPLLVQDILVFVETRPFRTYPAEPQSVPFSVLTDATYRDYRSPAGRASLEFAALTLCETYRRQHPDASIYYDDGTLRIYRFSGLPAR